MRWLFLKRLGPVFVAFFLLSSASYADSISFRSSTQFLWGDDLLGKSQGILAQYVRFSVKPESSLYSINGYMRAWKDLTENGEGVRDDDLLGRIYYLYLDLNPTDGVSFRLGRHFVNYSASPFSIVDGLSVSLKKIPYLNITATTGRDVIYALDSEYSRDGNYLIGVNASLDGFPFLQLGASYIRKYDESEIASDRFGFNFRYLHSLVSPYAEVRYDTISQVVDEAIAGVDLFPIQGLALKGEFYHSYPIFDTTSIYSVFAVDRYREYLLRAEYSFEKPVTLFGSYVRQAYQNGENTDNYIVGINLSPLKELKLMVSTNLRRGFGGNLFGFEISGDYTSGKNLLLSAGIQYDAYHRPFFEHEDYDYAHRLWIGGRYQVSKNASLILRLEDNINENFDHRPLGRIALTWDL